MSEHYAFWIVLGAGERLPPRHVRERDARAEAEHLTKTIGGTYFVLEAKHVFEREIRVDRSELYRNWDEIERLNEAERAPEPDDERADRLQAEPAIETVD